MSRATSSCHPLGTLGHSLCVIVYISPVVSLPVPSYVYSTGKSHCWATSLHHILLLGQISSVSFWVAALSLLPGSSFSPGTCERVSAHAEPRVMLQAQRALSSRPAASGRWQRLPPVAFLPTRASERVSEQMAAPLLLFLHLGRQGDGSKAHRSRFRYQRFSSQPPPWWLVLYHCSNNVPFFFFF